MIGYIILIIYLIIILIIYLIIGWRIANVIDTENMLLDALVMLLWPAIIIIVILALMLGEE